MAEARSNQALRVLLVLVMLGGLFAGLSFTGVSAAEAAAFVLMATPVYALVAGPKRLTGAFLVGLLVAQSLLLGVFAGLTKGAAAVAPLLLFADVQFVWALFAVAREPPTKLSLVTSYMDEVQKLDQAARAKKRFRNVEGFPFWPHEVVRDAIFLCFFLAILFALSGFIPYYLESPANPAGQPQVILPDWYLLWSYGLLKISFDVELFGVTLVTSKVFGVLLNGVVIAPLIFLPFIHPGHSRRPVEDPFWASVGAGGVMLAITLSAMGVNGIIDSAFPILGSHRHQIGPWKYDAWLSVLLPIVTFFFFYIPLKWRKSKLHYENKLSRNYYRIR